MDIVIWAIKAFQEDFIRLHHLLDLVLEGCSVLRNLYLRVQELRKTHGQMFLRLDLIMLLQT